MYKEGDTYHIYTHQKHGIAQLVVDGRLNVIKKSKIPVQVSQGEPYWARGNQVIDLEKDKLVLHQNGITRVLASDSEGMQAAGSQLMVWKKHKIFQGEHERLFSNTSLKDKGCGQNCRSE